MQVIKLIIQSGVIFTVLSFTGCEQKIENPKIPNQKEGYAIEAALTANDNAKAFISKSTSIQQGLKRVNPADVDISLRQDGKQVATLTDSGNGFFTASKQIKAGQTYEVRANGPEGMATGSTTIPAAVGVDTVIFEDSADRFPNNEFYHAIKIGFRDPGKTTDYYAIEGVIGTPESQSPRPVDLSYVSPAISFQYDDTKAFLKDQSFNGNRFSLTAYVNVNDFPLQQLRQNFTLRLKHVSESYFNYFQSLDQLSNNSGTNPFSNEPALTQGNVQGGFGCVGGLNVATAQIP